VKKYNVFVNYIEFEPSQTLCHNALFYHVPVVWKKRTSITLLLTEWNLFLDINCIDAAYHTYCELITIAQHSI